MKQSQLLIILATLSLILHNTESNPDIKIMWLVVCVVELALCFINFIKERK